MWWHHRVTGSDWFSGSNFSTWGGWPWLPLWCQTLRTAVRPRHRVMSTTAAVTVCAAWEMSSYYLFKLRFVPRRSPAGICTGRVYAVHVNHICTRSLNGRRKASSDLKSPTSRFRLHSERGRELTALRCRDYRRSLLCLSRKWFLWDTGLGAGSVSLCGVICQWPVGLKRGRWRQPARREACRAAPCQPQAVGAQGEVAAAHNVEVSTATRHTGSFTATAGRGFGCYLEAGREQKPLQMTPDRHPELARGAWESGLTFQYLLASPEVGKVTNSDLK